MRGMRNRRCLVEGSTWKAGGANHAGDSVLSISVRTAVLSRPRTPRRGVRTGGQKIHHRMSGRVRRPDEPCGKLKTVISHHGQLGVLPGHVPLLTQIMPGELDLKAHSKGDELAVGGGFAEITGSRVTILTDMAVKPDQIDEQAVERALESAKTALLEKKAGPEAEELMALIQRSTAQLQLKRKRRAQG